MPTIARIGSRQIQVYSGEHGVPHFHVVGPDGRASVAIATLQVLAGDLDHRRLAPALAWAGANRTLSLRRWLELNG